MGHVITENRHGLIVEAVLTTAEGTAEADAALLIAAAMREKGLHGTFPLGADMAYDQREVVETHRELDIVLYVARNNHRRSAINGHTTRHRSYRMSQQRRPLNEKVFGGWKPISSLRKVKLREMEKVWCLF